MTTKDLRIVNKYKFLDLGILCEVPYGWLDLVDQMAAEIQEEIERSGIEDYGVLQAKEKFGALRWYDYNGNQRIDEIIIKYEKLSSRTCCHCGKPATKISKGWICPWCDECAKEINGELR